MASIRSDLSTPAHTHGDTRCQAHCVPLSYVARLQSGFSFPVADGLLSVYLSYELET